MSIIPGRWRTAIETMYLRDFDGDRHLEQFLVSAVTSVLVIRGYLALTGYPQIGGGGLHIAHLLWGGLLMLVALLLLVTLLPNGARQPAAILGGIGFGAFIDEVGKFITKSNDYFYQPAAPIIYIVFLGLFLLVRVFDRLRPPTRQEYLVNALELTKAAVSGRLTEEHAARILDYVSHVPDDDPVAIQIKAMLHQLVPAQGPPLGLPARFGIWAGEQYHRVAGNRWFVRVLVGFFVLNALVTVLEGFLVLDSFTWSIVATLLMGWFTGMLLLIRSLIVRLTLYVLPVAGVVALWTMTPAALYTDLTLTEVAILVTSSLSAVLVLIGTVRIRGHRLFAFGLFQRALLISIFLTEPFSFYVEQFGALIGLSIDIFALVSINYFIRREIGAAQVRRQEIEQRADAGPSAVARLPAGQ